ncbi:MAG TPA: hypothetical protein VFQ57_10165 [Sphingomonas sp.]|jgi:hypothetical protein|nr:hypothetical protein [Sphingomonas sp.]
MILLALLIAAAPPAPKGASLPVAAKAASAPAADAGWPCEVEPKAVLAAGDYWPAVKGKAGAGWASDAAIVSLAGATARRSLPEDEATAQIRQFAAAHPDMADRAKLAVALTDTIDGERRTIIEGIRRFNVRQAQLAKRMEEGYGALDGPAAAGTPERRAALEEQAGWDQRIFEDRQRMLPIVCRQPAALETRLAALIGAIKEPTPK